MGQAAELLGVSVDTVRRWAEAGRLRTRRTGGGQRLVDGDAASLRPARCATDPPKGWPRPTLQRSGMPPASRNAAIREAK